MLVTYSTIYLKKKMEVWIIKHNLFPKAYVSKRKQRCQLSAFRQHYAIHAWEALIDWEREKNFICCLEKLLQT